MNRRQVLGALSASITASLAGCSVNVVENPQTVEASDYSHFAGRDLQSTNYTDSDGFQGYNVEWVSELSGDVWADPIVANDSIFVATYNNKVYSVDIETGSVEWTFSGLDGKVDGTPAYHDGTIYITSFDNNVYAIDSNTGELNWSRNMGLTIRSSPKVSNGLIYLGIGCSRGPCNYYSPDANRPKTGGIFALDTETGDTEWSISPLGDTVIASSAIDNGTLYTASSVGDVYAIDASSGNISWSVDSEWSIMSSPAITQDKVFFGDSITADVSKDKHRQEDMYVYAVDRETGEQVWRQSFDGHLVAASPAVDNKNVYVAINGITDNNQEFGDAMVVSFEQETGNINWESRFPLSRISSSPLVDRNRVYAGKHRYGSSAPNGGLIALGKQGGNTHWKRLFEKDDFNRRGVGTSPCIIRDKIIFTTTFGELHCYSSTPSALI